MIVSRMVRKMTMAAALAVPMALLPVAEAHAGVFISVGFAPPPLPVYVQPPMPYEGYIWTPGYWAYGDEGYYWVPGVWIAPPEPGLLWTPGYWGYAGGVYGWHAGYWGPHVGFYGGVNYGFGYGGIGFVGGEWRGGHFFYNSAVVNFGGVHVTNVYVNREIVVHNTIANPGHLAFNGPGGINRGPSPEEARFANERHVQPTGNQLAHETAARQDRSQLASVNHGRPATPAASSPAAYHQVAQQHAAAGQSEHPANGERPATGGRPTPQTSREPSPASRPAASPQHAPQQHAPAARPAARPQPERAAPAEKKGGHGGGGRGR